MAKEANCILPKCIYEKLKKTKAVDDETKSQILQNAYLAKKNMRPLCQDCGQVVIFLEIGQDIALTGDYLEDVINSAIADCYKNEFYRKSIVADAINNRENTKTNTPAIIHTRIVKGDEINILLALKGGGAENTSVVKMFNPTAGREEIYNFIKETIKETKGRACPPMSVGIGMGGTIEYACYLAKRALYYGVEREFDIEGVFELKELSAPTHIACLPVCININCHSARHSKCTIKEINGEYVIKFGNEEYNIDEICNKTNYIKVSTDEIKKIKELKKGDKIELSGIIYTARDMAHKRLVSMIQERKKLPFDLKNSIIFYAGPCPKNNNEVIGPTGPTTSSRMDKFAPVLYKEGVLATIGKGERKINEGIYFHMSGGVASLIKECIKNAEVIAFDDLGAEAIYKLAVKDIPLIVS